MHANMRERRLLAAQADGEGASFSRFALHRDLASQNIDDLLDEREPQPVPFLRMRGIPLVKFIKGMRARFRGHAAARIAHGKFGAAFPRQKGHAIVSLLPWV